MPGNRPASGGFVAIERGNVVIALVSLLVGAYLGNAIPQLFEDPDNSSYWALWLVTAAAILLVGGISAFVYLMNSQHSEGRDTINDFELEIDRLEAMNTSIESLVERAIGRQADLIPRETIYFEMAKAIDDATSDISVVTLLAMNWDAGERNWTPALTSTPGREDFYEAVKRAIVRQDVSYERIWQIPAEKADVAFDALFIDPLHRDEYDLIDQYRKVHPHLAKFMIASTITTASYVLIDGEKLFFNIDVYNAETGELESPYMLFIKDSYSRAFEPLRGLAARFTPLMTAHKP